LKLSNQPERSSASGMPSMQSMIPMSLGMGIRQVLR
jgi:hypothetical protein